MTAIRITALLSAVLLSLGCTTGSARVHERSRGLPGYIRGDADTPADRVIVFVHGFLGNGISTWTNDRTQAYFPKLLLDDPVFDGSDIWVDDFPSPLNGATYSIDELADHLRRHLTNDNVISNHRQVIFVAHSMGGLVIRAYLLKYREQLSPDRVSLLYFFATPTTGTDLANHAAVLSHTTPRREMRKLRTYEPGILGTCEAQWLSSPYVRTTTHCAYELKPTYGVLVVQRESAMHLCNASPDPIDTNHIEIAKPADRDDESYIAFRGAFREALHSHVPRLNLFGDRPPFLRLFATTLDLECATCRASELSVRPGEHVFVAAHFENYGNTVRRVRLHLDVPTSPRFDGEIYAALKGDDGSLLLQGGGCISAPSIPLLMLPIKADWYSRGSARPLPLRASAAISPSGLELGDLEPGEEFATDVVIEFQTVGVTLLAARDIGPLENRLRSIVDSSGDTVNVGEISDLLAPKVRIAEGRIDHSDGLEPNAWVSELKNLKHGEHVFVCMYVYNPFPHPLHDARIFVDQWLADSQENHLSVRMQSREGRWDLANAPMTFSDGTSRVFFTGAYRWPYGLCLRGLRPAMEVRNLPLSGDPYSGLPIGDLPADSTTIFALVFEVS